MKQLIWLFSLVASIAAAQSVTLIPGVLADCNSTDSVSITTAFSGNNPGTVVKAFTVTNSNPPKSTGICPDKNTSDKGDSYTLVTGSKINVPIKTLLAPYCGSTTGSGYATLCIYQTTQDFITQANYQYDTSPSKLTGISIAAGNKQVTVTINDPKSSNANYSPKYQVCYSATQADIDNIISTKAVNCGAVPAATGTTQTISITGLTNFTTYYFTASVPGSSPIWTDRQDATPINTDGFAEVYDGAPNPLSWSCAQTSATPGTWLLFLLLGVFLLRRRTPPVALVFLLATPVFADLGQVNLSIAGAPYRPNLDASTKSDGSTARQFYGTMFGDNLLPLMGIEVDVHMFDDFGSLQLGMGASYAFAGGSALKVDSTGQITSDRSPDGVGLHMLHLRPQLTYALDTWVDIVPLAPYIRGGIIAMGYMFTYQGSLDKENGNQKPLGFMFGWEAAAGLMLALDWLEPSVSKAARANDTYDHVYLKAEVAYMPINNFYQNGLDFSPKWPTDSLPLLLTFGLVFEFK